MFDGEIGEYIEAFRVRTKNGELGVTTTYIGYALDKKIIDGAIVVRADEKWKPETVVIKKSEELLDAVGTKWVISPMVNAIVDALKIERLERIAIIGTPCQCQAIRDMKEYPMQMGDLLERVKLIVGVFCMGSFTRDGFRTMIEKKFGIQLPDILNAEITKNSFRVELRDGSIKEISLDEFEENVQIPCLTCGDFTAESSDISFGNVGGGEGWKAAIVRKTHAMEIFDMAANEGYLEAERLENLDIIKKYAGEKKERAEKMAEKFRI